MEKGIYIYAVLDKKTQLGGYLKKTGLKFIEKRNLILVYKDIDIKKTEKEIENASKNLLTIKKLLVAHDKVINDLSHFSTLVPFRFGTVLKDVTSLQKLLEEKYDFFLTKLEKIRGKEEWGVRLFKNNLVFEKYVNTSQSQNTQMSGTAYLMKIKEEKDAEKKAWEVLKKIADEVVDQAKEFSTDISHGNPSRQNSEGNQLLLSNSFLINSKDRENFKNKIYSLKKKYQEMGVDLQLSGPWQPYSFV